jgi:hypothetical protein
VTKEKTVKIDEVIFNLMKIRDSAGNNRSYSAIDDCVNQLTEQEFLIRKEEDNE